MSRPSGSSPMVEAGRDPHVPNPCGVSVLPSHLTALRLGLLHLLDVHQVLSDLFLLCLCEGRGLREARQQKDTPTLPRTPMGSGTHGASDR